MDDSPKEENEIFSGTPPLKSDYQEATAVSEVENSQPEQVVESQPVQSAEIRLGENPAEVNNAPPPSFTEDDKKKKFIVFGALGLIILLVIFFIFNLLFQNRSKAPQAITLNYWGLWEDKNIFQPVFDEYKKTHANITINYIKQDPKLYRDRLKAALDKGEGPDIFRFHNTWVPMMKSYLSAMPKNIYTDSDFQKTFFPVATSDLKLGGNIYGIPLMIDGLVLFYNADILKGANVAVPQTWEDVQKAVPKLTVREKGKIVTAGIALGTAENIEHFSDILGLMFLQNGTKPEKSLFSCADGGTTTCGVEALTYYRKFAEIPNNTWDETLENSIVAFAGKKVAMIIAPSWEAFTIKELAKNSNLNFKVGKVPQLPCDKEPCSTVNWASYWVEGVSVKSKYQKEAWELVKYLSSQDTMRKLYELQMQSRILFGEPYSRVDLAKTLSDNPYLAPLMEEAPTMKSFYLASRTNDGDTGLNTTLITYLKNAVNSLSSGGTSIETALKTADEGFKQVYTRFGLITPASTQ